jgi:hypothetical protein
MWDSFVNLPCLQFLKDYFGSLAVNVVWVWLKFWIRTLVHFRRGSMYLDSQASRGFRFSKPSSVVST